MHDANPLLANILSLAQSETWQRRELSDEHIRAWLNSDRRDVTRVYLVGCGTSLYAGQVGKYILENLMRVPAEAILSFAFATYVESALLTPHTLVVGISATGKTQATVDALAKAKDAGAMTLALTGDATSGVTQKADATILVRGALNVSIKTRSYVQTLVALYLLALRLAEAHQRILPEGVDHWEEQIKRAADASRRFLEDQRAQIEQLADHYAEASNVFVLGSGPNTGTAEEASLKIIEMAKMYSASQDLENFLHGRLREVDQTTPMFFVAPHGPSSQRVLDFLTVTDYVGAPSVVLTDQVSSGMRRLASHIVQLPGGLDELATPLLYITPLYVFAYHLAHHRGYDPRSRQYPDIVPQNVRYGDAFGT